MSASEMLSVLESGDRQQVHEMYEQVGGADPALRPSEKPEGGPPAREAD